MQARRLRVCSLSGEPDFRDGFRNWIKNQVLKVKVYLGINNGHNREAWRAGEGVC
jgi:hypothetical protein